jgi:hypothetical protein
MPLRLASPNWPAEQRRGASLRRSALPWFVLLSLLVHGLSLQLKFDFWPIFPVDRGRSNLSVKLKSNRSVPSGEAEPASRQAVAKPLTSHVARPADHSAAAIPEAIQIRQPPASIDRADLIERSKAELDTASRRQMLDPMFAPTARKAPEATPLERATAITGMKIEERGTDVMRVTNADGSHYCLQHLPEIASRDIPGPLVSVPMKCQ